MRLRSDAQCVCRLLNALLPVMLKGCHSNWFELQCAKGGFCYVKLLCTVAPHALCLGLQEACLVQHWS